MFFSDSKEKSLLWENFYQISQIPRCSGNENEVASFLREKAEQAGCRAWLDQVGNLMVRKEASAGLEANETIIFQGHLDMVCEKNAHSQHDFKNDPLDLRILSDGGNRWLSANNTTLGADNGIALAIGMALIQDKTLRCGPIELLFTVDEECGLKGALNLDASGLKGKYLINLDSEEEGEFCVGCAGGSTLNFKKQYDPKCLMKLPDSGVIFGFEISGFAGGHSGIEIGQPRENAIIVTAQLYERLLPLGKVSLIKFDSIGRHNVISNSATMELLIQPATSGFSLADLQNEIKMISEGFQAELQQKEPTAHLTFKELKTENRDTTQDPSYCLKPTQSESFFSLIKRIPFGPVKWSSSLPGKVETSSNPASLSFQSGIVELFVSQRSFSEEALDQLTEQTVKPFEHDNWVCEVQSRYPGWLPDINSVLIKSCEKQWLEQVGKPVKLTAIHAGLECGVLQDKLPGCEMISMGPDIRDVHSPSEGLNMESAERILEFVKSVLKKGLTV